jgi:formylglycine-generating enzyme required for sulfatase activity
MLPGGRRLPTEKEWEYAARSGDRNFNYPWGNEFRPGIANVLQGVKKTKPAALGPTRKIETALELMTSEATSVNGCRTFQTLYRQDV